MSAVDVSFPCMGATARLLIEGPDAHGAERRVRALLERLEACWTRFDASSELSALNEDPRAEVPASPLLRELLRAGLRAGRISGGLVDITLGDDVRRAGYRDHWIGPAAPLADALAAAPVRRPATPDPAARWARVAVDEQRGTVRRPPGLIIDSGGIGKGLAADLAARELPGHRFVVDVGGDLALSRGRGPAFVVPVEHPVTAGSAATLRLAGGGVATSGITRRLWRDEDGHPAHHVLDPATGRPAWTGLLAATAVGRCAAEAEVLAKTALLTGPVGGRAVLARLGGVLVDEAGGVDTIPPLALVAARGQRILREARAHA